MSIKHSFWAFFSLAPLLLLRLWIEFNASSTTLPSISVICQYLCLWLVWLSRVCECACSVWRVARAHEARLCNRDKGNDAIESYIDEYTNIPYMITQHCPCSFVSSTGKNCVRPFVRSFVQSFVRSASWHLRWIEQSILIAILLNRQNFSESPALAAHVWSI